MAEREVNLQYAYNSLMGRYTEAVKENSYKDAVIATMEDEIDQLKADKGDKEDNEEDAE